MLLGPLVAANVPDIFLGTTALIAALANGWRMAGWRSLSTIKEDALLWSLHLGFAMLVFGYALLAAAWLTDLLNPESALHGLAIGAVGGMTLAVMTRAPLGHTGRPLHAGRAVAVSYVLVAAAMIVRVGGVELLSSYTNAIVLFSGSLWVAAFALYLAAYWPVLNGPSLGAQPA